MLLSTVSLFEIPNIFAANEMSTSDTSSISDNQVTTNGIFEMSVDPHQGNSGDTFHFSYRFGNNGDYPFSNVIISDDNFDSENCTMFMWCGVCRSRGESRVRLWTALQCID